MGLFNTKRCAVCGGLGMIGYTRIDGGQICKACKKKLSFWFMNYEFSTPEDIKAQIEYRKDNCRKLAGFNATYVANAAYLMRILVDENEGTFMVTEAFDSEIAQVNPDVFSVDDIQKIVIEIKDYYTTEVYRDTEVYDIFVNITIDEPYVHGIRFRLNEGGVKVPHIGKKEFDPMKTPQYRHFVELGEEIKGVLEGCMAENQEETDFQTYEDENQNKIHVMKCPWCGSNVKIDYKRICPNCGGNLDA